MPRKGKVELALNRALRAAALTPSDEAAVELARLYARRVDEGMPLWNIGGQFRELLIELGLTPKARKALLKDRSDTPAESPLDELRKRREARG